ncbi:UDP-glucose/GDP-mannose dehydrogenase family protein [candidate division TA06 bacterium]|uniref:UDP-glucose 6-dehydrogenase n=1 Tax=candidate division TA06 bacterium TaxID=2250710 RepID=A0A523UXX9_UNCT6|nr:MAG: UDP-glucose/GDP-mannose dehydrogenase family protein [candidate division TA06 bacterium]
MNIGVVGSGHVGLVTGACLAELGHTSICDDDDVRKIEMLKNGQMPFYEPGLKEMVDRNVAAGRLEFTTDIAHTIERSRALFIAVGTPPREDGEADLSTVEAVASRIAETMREYKLVVEKSTVPVHTGIQIKRTMEMRRKNDVEFDVASNPEFLREGSAVHDFMNPDRVVIGFETERARRNLLEIYGPLKAPIIETDMQSAEIIKHASNSFLSMKISFINAISIICEMAGADVLKVAEGVGMDKRIGRAFLDAGVGFGGFCFPKDIRAFVRIAEKLGYDFRLLKEVERINEEQKERFVAKVKEVLWNLSGKTIGVLGLAFKPNTDDMRYAPSLDIINGLLSEGAKVKAYDPAAMDAAKKLLNNVEFCKDPYDTAKDADAVALVTEWEEFEKLDLEKLKTVMRSPVLIDGRNVFDPETIQELGFVYKGMGR